jgi:hypothetical protein
LDVGVYLSIDNSHGPSMNQLTLNPTSFVCVVNFETNTDDTWWIHQQKRRRVEFSNEAIVSAASPLHKHKNDALLCLAAEQD